MKSLNIGDQVKWVSAAGTLVGKVYNICLSKNAADQLIPWIDIQTDKQKVRLCALESNLKMMKVERI